MSDDDVNATTSPARGSRPGLKIALVGAGIAAGAITASAFAANAQSTTSGSGSASADSGSTQSSFTGSTSSDSTQPAGRPGGFGPGRSDEKSVSAAVAAKLKAAALKAVPGGTVDRVETDAGDATYEAHMTKSDGSHVTVKFAKDLSVTGVETGMGRGDPAPQH